MCQNEANMLFLAKSFAFVLCLSLSSSRMSPEIKLDMISICTDTAAIGWMVFPAAGDTMEPLSNCSLFGYPETYRFHYLPKIHQLKASGVYKFQQKLLVGERYSFQIRCGEIVSNSVSFIALDNCTSSENFTSQGTAVVYQDQSGFFLGSRDSVLGVIFGLFGLLIILVTSFYLWRKYRNRQRRQRIRNYLGASLIDPFANMQSRMDEMEASGGQRLMGSSESL